MATLSISLPVRPRVIVPDEDQASLRVAFLQLFEESFQRGIIERTMSPDRFDQETRDRALDDVDQRTLSPGFYTRAVYLFDLGNAIEAGATFAASQLSRDDVRGLTQLAGARVTFLNDHPPCPQCGERQQTRHFSACQFCDWTKGGG